ncbi:glycosyltransferase family 1 protein [Candidatus Woesearchaeota archaeon]|nr:MAG: glycosyltransferase family 1 protein [Candidatus Woesearchaeota archaeon]
MKKVLFLAGYFYPHEGGSEKFILHLAKELMKSSVACTVITANTEKAKAKEKYQGINIIRVPCWHLLGKKFPMPKPWSMVKVLQEKEPYDIIITNTRFFNIAMYAPFFKWKHHAKLIHIEHGSKHIDNESAIVSFVNKLYDHTIGWFVMKNADYLFGISKEAQKLIKHICNKKSGIVRNCIDTAYFIRNEKEAEKIKRKYKITKSVILYAGRIIEAKGVQDLITATKNIDAQVIIIGSGSYEAEIKKMLHQNCTFINKDYDHKTLKELLTITDIFVNPSYNEGLPTVVMESGSMEVAVVATDVGGTKEIIDDKVNGFLVEPKNKKQLTEKINILLKNKIKRETFGKALRQRIQKEFDVSIAFQPIVKIVKQEKKGDKHFTKIKKSLS